MNSIDILEKLMVDLSKKLTIVEIGTNGISYLKNIENENLFIKNYIDNIMADIPSIISGNGCRDLSIVWKFVSDFL